MIKNSKAQGLSLNAIIIGVLVLIVLLVLVGITTGYFSKWKVNFSSATDTCQGNGGKILDKSGAACPGEYVLSSSTSYPDFTEQGQKCCLPTCSGVGACRAEGSGCGDPTNSKASPCCPWENNRGKRDCASGQACCKAK